MPVWAGGAGPPRRWVYSPGVGSSHSPEISSLLLGFPRDEGHLGAAVQASDPTGLRQGGCQPGSLRAHGWEACLPRPPRLLWSAVTSWREGLGSLEGHVAQDLGPLKM